MNIGNHNFAQECPNSKIQTPSEKEKHVLYNNNNIQAHFPSWAQKRLVLKWAITYSSTKTDYKCKGKENPKIEDCGDHFKMTNTHVTRSDKN